MAANTLKNKGEQPDKRRNVTSGKIWEDPLYGSENPVSMRNTSDMDESDPVDPRLCGHSDAEDFDGDGTPFGEGADDEEENQFSDYTAVDVQSDGPDLSLAKIHEIRVKEHDGEYVCEYRPMPWQETGDRFAVAKRTSFLRTCARWLEMCKQEFLSTRLLETYCKDDIEARPIVEQKGFLERIKPILDTQMKDEDELRHFLPSMGRILPSIYLVWEDGISLSMSVLFGKEAKQCWEKVNRHNKSE